MDDIIDNAPYWNAYAQAMQQEEFFQAHEILEIPWRRTKQHRLQIAIWIAAADVHWSRHHHIGAIKLFRRILDDPRSTTLPIMTSIQMWYEKACHGDAIQAPTKAEIDKLRDWGQG